MYQYISNLFSNHIKSIIYAKLEMINNIIKYLYHHPKLGKKINYYNIPIIINNYNRLSFLKKLINSLETRGYYNIYIIDNASTYPPLLEFYKSTHYPIFFLNKNVGYKALWETDIFEQFKDYYYVYTDSDMEIDENCPSNFMEFFFKIMKRHPFSQKVGFGIRIDDLPNEFENKNQVIQHEKQFWSKEVSKGVYAAMIDTTFALYRPFCSGPSSPYQKTYRTGKPYLIKHLPWYINSSKLDDEEIYYIKSIKRPTHWTAVAKNNLK